jgi:hypothetical protein
MGNPSIWPCLISEDVVLRPKKWLWHLFPRKSTENDMDRLQWFSLSNRSSSVLVLRVKMGQGLKAPNCWSYHHLGGFQSPGNVHHKFILNEDHWIIQGTVGWNIYLKKKERKTNHCSHLTSLDHLSRSPWLFPAFFSKWILNLPASSSFAVANDAGDASPYWSYLPYIRPFFKAYVREYPQKIWPEIWYSTNVPPI